MARKKKHTVPDVIYCRCGCGEEVPKKKYPSQQNYFINGHQHRGKFNGNYKGGKSEHICPVCLEPFYDWKSQGRVTCGDDACYRKWQGLTTSARGTNKVKTECATCGRQLVRWPSQIQEKNYCNRHCLAADNPQNGSSNGNWRGGRWKFIQEQVLIRDNRRCVICGFDYCTDVHHITPRTEGGTNDFHNLITLCPNHHRMADDGVIDLEHMRNYDWKPSDTVDTNHPPVSNR